MGVGWQNGGVLCEYTPLHFISLKLNIKKKDKNKNKYIDISGTYVPQNQNIKKPIHWHLSPTDAPPTHTQYNRNCVVLVRTTHTFIPKKNTK